MSMEIWIAYLIFAVAISGVKKKIIHKILFKSLELKKGKRWFLHI